MSFLPPQTIQRITKDLKQLEKKQIEDIEIQEVVDLSEISAIITGPQGTPFEGGKFLVKLSFSEEFPAKPPKGKFCTKIFHPNVQPTTGEICVNTLKRDWDSSLGLQHILVVIRCLMIEPNPDSALNAEAGQLIQDDYSAFIQKAKMMTSIYAMTHQQKENHTTNIVNINSNPSSTPIATTAVPVKTATAVSKKANLKQCAFATAKEAQIICKTLQVDRELNADKLERITRIKSDTESNILVTTFRSNESRLLRVSVKGYLDSMILACKTLELFSKSS